MTIRYRDVTTRRQTMRAGLAVVGGVVVASAEAQEKIAQAQGAIPDNAKGRQQV